MAIDFTCPHCGTQTNVGDQYAGQTGSCASCGESITIPGPSGRFQDAPAAAPPAKSGPSGLLIFGIVGGAGCVVILVIGILMALLLPAIGAAREVARRMQCSNQLKQIGIAMMSYEAKHGCLPPAYIADETGRPMHSWRVLILPYLEESYLYEQYDFDEPWDSANNLMVAETMPAIYACPSDDNQAFANETGYMAITGPGGIFDGDKTTKSADVTDGTSTTLLVVESTGSAVSWTDPTDLDASTMTFAVNGGPGEIGSQHQDGANVLFADCHTAFLTEDTPPATIKAMTTIAGGEAVDASGL